MTEYDLVPVDGVSAREWARDLLRQGSALAGFVVQRLTDFSRAYVVAPRNGERWDLDDTSRGLSTRQAAEVLGGVLETLGPHGARLLIVEDDLARRGDARVGGDVAFIGDRVVRWAAIEDGRAALSHLVMTGASGYPLNALVCNEAAQALSLAGGVELNPRDVTRAAESVVAVLTSVHDGETFMILATPQLHAVLGGVG